MDKFIVFILLLSFSNNGIPFLQEMNQVPIADAGTYQIVEEGKLVILDGTASYDEENEALNYNWSSLDGLTLNNANTPQANFVAPDVLAYQAFRFSLQVNDGQNNSLPDEVEMNIVDPEWIPRTYDNGAMLVASLTSSGIAMETGDILGVFVNGECRGVGFAKVCGGTAYVEVDIQLAASSIVNFRVIDISAQTECTVGTSTQLAPDQLLGTSNMPFVIEADCCSNGTLNIPEVTATVIAPGVYQSSSIINADGIIEASTQVRLFAQQEINLTAGFHAKVNSDFLARIQDCN